MLQDGLRKTTHLTPQGVSIPVSDKIKRPAGRVTASIVMSGEIFLALTPVSNDVREL